MYPLHGILPDWTSPYAEALEGCDKLLVLPPLENSYTKLPPIMFEKADPLPVSQPTLLASNHDLAERLGISSSALHDPEGIDTLAGNRRWNESEPIALAYAGHQFGGFSGRLGDGRAHLLGELVDHSGKRFDIQLKGSGPTPYSRGGDGRSALGPVMREYLVSEWMHTMGVPTTRALAAIATGDRVYREAPLPGGILTRVASSHLRVGSFEYLASIGDQSALAALVNYALERHYPDSDDGRPPALRLLEQVIISQANLIPKWMGLGFIHGVMNTDNCSISGETIDYGPCAFMDSFDPSRKFSSIDRGGRYAYDQQAKIAQWNLARLAEALLPLIASEEGEAVAQATSLLQTFPSRYERNFADVCRRKLGNSAEAAESLSLMSELLVLMRESKADFTLTFRRLYEARRSSSKELFIAPFKDSAKADDWFERLSNEPISEERSELMRLANPLFIPRNHRLEEVIEAGLQGDFAPFQQFMHVLEQPCDAQPNADKFAEAPGDEQWSHVTFCGT